MQQVYNFSAGPAMLPAEVMKQAQEEFLDWQQRGVSVMEISHRSPAFEKLAAQIEQDVRELLHIPKNYKVLFMQGGGRAQFAMVPMNLLGHYKKAAYVTTGFWSEIAAKEAEIYGQVQVAADSKNSFYTSIPHPETWRYDHEDSAYLHYVDNETINGVEFPYVPESNLPLVSDMSSNILSRKIDVSKFGVIYACSQKNIAPAGLTLVIIREELLQRQPIITTPSIFRYHLAAENQSMLNTPVTFSWYMASLVFQWIKKQGGVSALQQKNQRNAKKLYDFIDQSNFYRNNIDPEYRSSMNVVFRLTNENLETEFLASAERHGFIGLKGHRLAGGGMRASIYNAMPEIGVTHLIEFMKNFAELHD